MFILNSKVRTSDDKARQLLPQLSVVDTPKTVLFLDCLVNG